MNLASLVIKMKLPVRMMMWKMNQNPKERRKRRRQNTVN